ncbi:MAG TPA: hypothetical protein VIC82_04375 [Candidatus Nanopelagicales bacterium]|jgi:hypothetical protein
MGFHWRYENADGSELAPTPESAATEAFPSQGDAESWIGEAWPDLLASGVDQVTLVEDGRVVYGPMSLHES